MSTGKIDGQVWQLMQDRKVQAAIKNAKSPEEAAALMIATAGAAAAGLDVQEVARTLASFESADRELNEADLVGVVGGMLMHRPNTGGHTQCCYHCYG